MLAEALLRRNSRVRPPVASTVTPAAMTTGRPEDTSSPTAPVTAPSVSTRSAMHRSPIRRTPDCLCRALRSVLDTAGITRVIEETFEFLPDDRHVHERWRALLERHEIKGVQVHDARLAAAMYVHGITQLLTMNVRDFQRFTGLNAIHPADRIRRD